MADKDNKVVKKRKKVSNKNVIEKKNVDNPKKYSFSLSEVILVMIATALLGLFIGGFVTYKKYNNRKVSCNAISEDTKDITTVYDSLVNEYYGDIDKENLVDFAISGMINGLNDRYALYMDEDYASSLNEELKGSFVGLGVEVRNDEDGYITVVSVMDNSPAFKYGLEAGDKITSIDGINLIGEDVSVLVKNVKSNKAGTEKNIGIKRDDESFVVKVVLDVVNLKSVNEYFVERDGSKIGVIILSNFSANTYTQFVDSYNNLKEEGITSLVIDVRNNGGGYLSSANSISSMFLNNGDVIYKKTDGKNVEDVINYRDKEIDIPVVLLVNELTASSSEIFVSSLKENCNALIVGTRTYGKGMIQKLIELSGKKYVKFSVQEWLTASGNKVDGIGIIPDVEILFDSESGYDVQLEKAFELAKGQ